MNDPCNTKRSRDSTHDEDNQWLPVSKRSRLGGNGDYNTKRAAPDDQTPRKLSQDHYHIGWVCALPLEMAAAEAMLDNIHESPCSHPDDSNTYTFGNVGMHNIIVACLPSGQYGTNNAATVANNMRRSFPSIQRGFMVGIGGGVPGKVDVRLGDVVVGDRVIQYDFGKTVQDGHFERTSTPYKPPHELMTAVAKLRAEHERKPSRIPDILSAMLERNPNMTAFSRHSGLEDLLFDDAYDHRQSMETCENCDRSKLLTRAPRRNNNPEIHYGLIASGNQVMKHGKTRNQVAQGPGILCFEMEAAGLTDHFPCLVVRGVCDYSDSHKSKQWQRYAAATAAAYAKELLRVIPAVETPEVVIEPAREPAILQERRKSLLDSLRFDQIDSRHSNIRAAYSKTCEWLLRHPDYTDWLDPDKFDHHHGFLWINGKPGSGKSTLMKFAFAHAKQSTANNAATISFFFNARGDTLEKTAIGMYRALLVQLLEKLPDLQEVLDDPHLVAQNHNGSLKWDVEMLRAIFSSAIARLGRRPVTCFVDALDECDEHQVRAMVEFFEGLGEEASQGGIRLYICFSSRHYPYIAIEHGQQLVLENQPGHGQDLERYVRGRLKTGKRSFLEEVRNQILQKAAGVFMWAVLVVDILNKEFDRGRMFAVRKRLQEIPNQLSELFKDILRRDSDNMAEMLLCIQWILHAKRPLKREEFYFAVVSGVSPESLTEWNPEDISTDDMGRLVLSSSKGLAEVTKSRDQTVQFIHESVRDFLIKDGGLRDLWDELGEDIQSSSHDKLKQCCQTYIEMDLSGYLDRSASVALPKASSEEAKTMRQLVSERFPFLEYAVHHVFHHANEAAVGIPQDTFLERFPLGTWIKLDNLFEKHQIRRHTPNASLLYLLAEKNWARLIRPQLHHNPRVTIHGERHHYPLFAALLNGHQDAVEAILQQEINLPQRDNVSLQLEYEQNFVAPNGLTVLSWAVKNRHKSIVKMLLESSEIDASAKDRVGRTPLWWAVKNGQKSIVKLLLETGKVDPDTKDIYIETPLCLAVRNGHEAIIKLLLETGKVDPDTKDNTGQTPLCLAVRNGHEAIIKLLLETGKVDPDTKDIYGETPLCLAVRNGHEAIIKLLLETGKVDPDTKNIYGETPLYWAVWNRHEAIVKLLRDTSKAQLGEGSGSSSSDTLLS